MSNVGLMSMVRTLQTFPIKKIWRKAVGCRLLAVVFILSSCSTTKDTSGLRMMSANHLSREIKDNNFDFDKLEAKFNATLSGKNKMGLKGQLRIQNDSVIWVSISMKLGIEVARVMITNDSVKFINKTSRTYISEDINTLLSENVTSAVSLQLIEDMLTGNDNTFEFGSRPKVITEKDRYKLSTGIRLDSIAIAKDTWIIPETFRIGRQEIRIKDRNDYKEEMSLSISYDNFQDVNKGLIPSKIIFESPFINQSVEIEYYDIKIGERLSFPFKISKKFDRIYLW